MRSAAIQMVWGDEAVAKNSRAELSSVRTAFSGTPFFDDGDELFKAIL